MIDPNRRTTTKHLSGIQKYPGWNWKKTQADRTAARIRENADDRAHFAQLRHTGESEIEAQDAASAEANSAEMSHNRDADASAGAADGLSLSQIAGGAGVGADVAGRVAGDFRDATSSYGQFLKDKAAGIDPALDPEAGQGEIASKGDFMADAGDALDAAGRALAMAGAVLILGGVADEEIDAGNRLHRTAPEIVGRIVFRTSADVLGATGGGIVGGFVGGVIGACVGGIPIIGALPFGIIGGAGGAYAGQQLSDDAFIGVFGR
jgi:hypothetical protein